MIGLVFQCYKSERIVNRYGDYGPNPLHPYGSFSNSFKDAFDVARSLRSQGFRAVIKVSNPNYTI